MTEIIKQRLVGLMLVVIAGVIFLPDILDGKKELTKEEFKKIPPRPEVTETPYLSDFPTEKVITEIAKVKQAAKTEQQAADEPKSAVDSEQEGSFVLGNETANAETSDPAVANLESNVQQDEPVTESNNSDKLVNFEDSAWVLQLGSFRQKENADALKQKITEAGFTTFIKPVQTKAGVLSKVFVGPELDRSVLDNAQAQLKQVTGLDGKVTPYVPVE